MITIPASVAAFLEGKRVVVAGVSRSGKTPANLILRRLADTGHEVIPVNPKTTEVEGRTCYADVRSVPGAIDGVMIVTHPTDSAMVVRESLERGVKHIWFHRSFGDGSVSSEALDACRAGGVEPIVGGCPLMYCQPVDVGHRCFRWLLAMQRRVPE